MSVKMSGFANVWSQSKPIRTIFTYLMLWFAAARHNFKWVQILNI